MSKLSINRASEMWRQLRRFTDARIALGFVGASMPTGESLRLEMDQARARDAVRQGLDTATLIRQLRHDGFLTLQAWSGATNRKEYLRRPDLGRRLADECRHALEPTSTPPSNRLTIVIADGLSALAAAHHALPLVRSLHSQIPDWSLDAVVVATQARVALADEIGALRGSEAVVILIGERPGLSSPHSLGIYLTYRPHVGRTDAERNCISNVRPGGLSYEDAAYRLGYLLRQVRMARRSGLAVKDDSNRIERIPGPLPNQIGVLGE